MSFFIGPWSDRNGRKPLLLIPVLGFMLMYAGFLFLSLGFARDFNTYYLLLASIPVAFSGNLIQK
jgi:MFS transporter, PCFT/HCP family, solute carrier family 46 (folate transporter), member 1